MAVGVRAVPGSAGRPRAGRVRRRTPGRAEPTTASSRSPRSSSESQVSAGSDRGRAHARSPAVPGRPARPGPGTSAPWPRRAGHAGCLRRGRCRSGRSDLLTASHFRTISSTVAGKLSCREPSGRNTCGLRRTILALRPRATSSNVERAALLSEPGVQHHLEQHVAQFAPEFGVIARRSRWSRPPRRLPRGGTPPARRGSGRPSRGSAPAAAAISSSSSRTSPSAESCVSQGWRRRR